MRLGVLPVRNTVLFPGLASQLLVGRPASIELIEHCSRSHEPIVVVAQRRGDVEDPGAADLYDVGVLAQIDRVVQLPDGHLQIVVQGTRRVRLVRYVEDKPHLVAQVEPLFEIVKGDQEELALARNLATQFGRIAALTPGLAAGLQATAAGLQREPGRLADFVAAMLDLPLEEKQRALETLAVAGRLESLTMAVNRELALLEVGRKIQAQVQQQFGQAQRQQYLREQMRIIRQELGDEAGDEIEELRRQAAHAGLSAAAKVEVERELNQLARLPMGAAEYTVARTHLDWLLSLPWRRSSPSRLDVERTQRILDEDHDGLTHAKERIVEYVAVRKLRRDCRGPILCFVGPPGVGKSSLGRSIARAMGRRFVRISLGGVRDESEIRGHRRTYVGALPGRIIEGLRRAGTNNPVVVLDEIDKLGRDVRGDPAAALLEVLDPEQNAAFLDHYLDVPFDLSRVIFIATANQLDPVPPALRDRLEVIELAGYTEMEKLEIARNHLLPRQLSAHGLARRHLSIDDDALKALIRGYTREAGVRALERELGRLCRKIALEIVAGKRGPLRLDVARMVELLGPGKYLDDAPEAVTLPGIAAGLAWTAAGGEVMLVEAGKMPGEGKLTMTGKLGDVMRESAQIALSYVRSTAREWGIDPSLFVRHDIHIHVPSGAVPKDGPSAGVALATALLSLVTGQATGGRVAMTGEITLRGRVLPVGGVKEKVLAAHREGYHRVILPRRNANDLDDLPAPVRNSLDIVLVEHLSEAFTAALSLRARQAA